MRPECSCCTAIAGHLWAQEWRSGVFQHLSDEKKNVRQESRKLSCFVYIQIGRTSLVGPTRLQRGSNKVH